MKTQTQVLQTLAFWMLPATLLLQPLRVGAQGSLTPSGAPAPMMKTLAQMEPRTAITGTGAVTISVPGSYYLTTNITVASGDAITIAANNVTLDLNGFSISSTLAAAAGSGILLSGGRTNIAIHNGHIISGVTNNAGTFSGSGFNYGIYYNSAPPHSVRVKDVSVTGVLVYGLYLGQGNSSVATACTVDGVGLYGIFCDSVADSTVSNCGYLGIYGTSVVNSYGYSVGSSYGVFATTALNCSGYNNSSGVGLYAVTAQNCYGSTASGGDGLYAATAENCYGINGGGNYGLYASCAQNCYGYNSGGGYGVYAVEIAIGCRGFSYTGTGLNAYIANSSRGVTVTGTAQNVSFKYNMP
jgi:hypothetical protein